ncbi:MAG: hypothetical protein HQ580_15705 [Planctomycetes bacterium]|nr:hypothetical protein [Planctomycetota bacterium]
MDKSALSKEVSEEFLEYPLLDIPKAVTVGQTLKILKYLWPAKSKYKRIFSNIEKSCVIESLENAVRWIIDDRISEGEGKGGWGKSERAWMTHVFGEAAGRRTNEAIFTTVVITEALHRHTLLQKKLGRKSEYYRWDDTIKGLMPFLIDKKRYSERTGKAGKLGTMGSDGGWKPNYDYRHTALILRLWNLSSVWKDYYFRTTSALLENFDDEDFVDWKKERVVTLIMAYKALKIIKESGEDCSGQELENKIDVIRGKIVDKFDPDLIGWPAKSVDDSFTNEMKIKSRNYYTLLTLAMIPEEWEGQNSELKEMMTQSLNATCRYHVREGVNNTYYICRAGSDRPDLAATLIAFSAFTRKTRLNKQEQLLIQGISRYILNRFEKGDFNYNDPYDCPYGWAVPYFALDVCEILLQETW